ncbi:sensor histidine kinase [Halovenus marina]|uniref:sensor histidine kinase n=1 Tax=Halovenus marina TaxID=3396621 RepID=UPI003F578FC5
MTAELPEADLETLLEHSQDIITVVDEDGRLQYGSQSIERLLGYDPSMLVGVNVFEYVHDDDRDRVVEALIDPTAGPDAIEFRIRHASGSWVWLEAVASTEQDRRLGGYVINSRDITGRKEAEAQQRAILDRMTDAFYALDSEWQFTYLNDRAAELLDSDPEALVGESLWEAFPEASETVISDKFHEAMNNQESLSFDIWYDPLATHFFVQVYPSESGLTVYFRDITEHQQLRDQLQKSVNSLSALYELASDIEMAFETKLDRILNLGVAHLDLPYGFLTRITNDRQHIIKSVGDHELLQAGESCPLSDSYCRKTIRTEGSLTVTHAGEEGWEDDSAYDVFGLESYVGAKVRVDGELYGTLCFADSDPRPEFTDFEQTFVELTSRWLAYEISGQRYQAQLEERNERLEEFTSLISHDLRNPLNVAELRLDAARGEFDSEDLEAVAEAHERMEALIDDVLTLARQGEPVSETESIDMTALVEDCWEGVETTEATLENETSGSITADRSRLQQIFENLFRNSIDHAGPSVTITVGNLPDGFYVEDDGPGIPESERESVFEKGHTTAEDGTGFGLTIVRRVANAHGWEVDIEDGADGGARFAIIGVLRE